jgi:hypothetical protein
MMERFPSYICFLLLDTVKLNSQSWVMVGGKDFDGVDVGGFGIL